MKLARGTRVRVGGAPRWNGQALVSDPLDEPVTGRVLEWMGGSHGTFAFGDDDVTVPTRWLWQSDVVEVLEVPEEPEPIDSEGFAYLVGPSGDLTVVELPTVSRPQPAGVVQEKTEEQGLNDFARYVALQDKRYLP